MIQSRGVPMRCVTRQILTVVWLACGLLAAYGVRALADDPPPKELSKVDRERVNELYAKASALGKEGKFVEAQEPVQEILALCTRELGANHRKTGDYRREIETLKKLAALSDADKLEYRKTYGFSEE